MTHDRVLRFVPEFASAEQAARYAIRQAMARLGSSTRAAMTPAAVPEHADGH